MNDNIMLAEHWAIIISLTFNYFNLQLNQISNVLNGTLVYNVTPAMILTEWHRLYSTAQKSTNSLMGVVQLIQNTLFSQIPPNSTVDWAQVLLNRWEESP